jgi:pimeloyl-ACP methyl ester carboxylesterase
VVTLDDEVRPADTRHIRPPGAWTQLLEHRVPFEVGALLAASPMLRMLGRGDRHPVLVLPGFTGGDSSTAAIRWAVRSWGYWAHGWGLGRNLGPSDSLVGRMVERLEEIHRRHDTKVSLIGWSLGGIYARELARELPGHVRQVITLGSPFRMVDGDRSAVSRLADQVAPRLNTEIARLMRMSMAEHLKPPVPVPTTAVYSRTDGVVRWHTCIDTVGPQHENIEVRGSHSGMGFNPSVLYVLSDRLAQPADDWRPFHAPPHLRRLYPRPASWAEPAPRARRRSA